MIYLVYEQVLKLYVASSVFHFKKEVMLQRVSQKAYLFYIFEFES
jgi:hypothetical protein